MVLAGGICADFSRRILLIRDPASAEPISRRASYSQLEIMGLDHAVECRWSQCLYFLSGSMRRTFEATLRVKSAVIGQERTFFSHASSSSASFCLPKIFYPDRGSRCIESRRPVRDGCGFEQLGFE